MVEDRSQTNNELERREVLDLIDQSQDNVSAFMLLISRDAYRSVHEDQRLGGKQNNIQDRGSDKLVSDRVFLD